MKFFGALLALSAIQGTSAFTVASPKVVSTTLKASYDPNSFGVPSASAGTSAVKSTSEIWKDVPTVRVQGDTLKTCSFEENIDKVEVVMKTEGRPLDANVELWQGHHNSPMKMNVYLEDGSLRSFRALVPSPGSSNSISIRNTATMEFPLVAGIETAAVASSASAADSLSALTSRTVQGGAVFTTPFSPSVQSVQVMLKTDGRPLNARVELLQGPNNTKQVMEIYSEDGKDRPFYFVIDTPGTGNVIRIVNTATVEFPMTAWVEPHITDSAVENAAATNEGLTWS